MLVGVCPGPQRDACPPPLGVLSTGETLIMLLQSQAHVVSQHPDYSSIPRVKRMARTKS